MNEIVIKSYRKERQAEILNGLQQAIEKACVLVQNDAKRNIVEHSAQTPWQKTGRVASAVNHEIKTEGDAIIGEIKIMDESYKQIGRWLELGHPQHPGQYVPAIGKRLVAGEVPPYPWLFPAVESNRDKIIELLKRSGAKGILMGE